MPRDRTPLVRGPGDKSKGILRARLPDDFADRAPTMLLKDLIAHYGRSYRVIWRWLEEAGVKTMAPPANIPPAHATQKMLAARRRILAFKQNGFATGPVDRPRVDASRAGQAADYLRRFGPVVRCDREGRYSERGTFWRRGASVLSADDIIQRAERNGWNPDAWRMVA